MSRQPTAGNPAPRAVPPPRSRPTGTARVDLAHGSLPRDRRPFAAAVLAAAAARPLAATLRGVVEAAVDHVDAGYGALGVLSRDGRALERFVVAGIDDDEAEGIRRLPTGNGVLGLLIADPRVHVLDDLGAHPASAGFPPGHPPMRTFLGVPVRVRGTVFGHLYLTEKRGGGPFTAGDVEAAEALAAVAGLAIDNAREAERAEQRSRWEHAGTQIGTSLLSGEDPEAVLRSVAERVAALASAETVGVLVPDGGDDEALTVSAAFGRGAADLEGVRVPLADTHVGRVYRSGRPAVVADTGVDPVLGRHAAVAVEITRDRGPGLMLPLAGTPSVGMIVALRDRGREPFDPDLLEPAGAFAAQAALALSLARSRQLERRLQLQADRDRIARDLHDHVVQRIFATALALDRLSRSVEQDRPDVAERICHSVDELDSTIAEIRAAIFELHHEQDLPPTSLRQQLADVVRRATEGRPLRRDVRVRGAVDDLPAELLPDLLAVVRELVANVVRHASASRVTVTVTIEDEVRVVVTDDGVGLRPGAARSGLANLASRAERRGGSLTTALRRPGTQLRWAVPIART